jgi:hypothetical protein
MRLKLIPREGWMCPVCGAVWAPGFPGPCRHPRLGKALTRDEAWRALGGEGSAPDHESDSGGSKPGGSIDEDQYHQARKVADEGDESVVVHGVGLLNDAQTRQLTDILRHLHIRAWRDSAGEHDRSGLTIPEAQTKILELFGAVAVGGEKT